MAGWSSRWPNRLLQPALAEPQSVPPLPTVQVVSDVAHAEQEQVDDAVVGNARDVGESGLQAKPSREVFELVKVLVLDLRQPRLLAALPEQPRLDRHGDSPPLPFGDEVCADVIDTGDFEAFADERVGDETLAEVAQEFRGQCTRRGRKRAPGQTEPRSVRACQGARTRSPPASTPCCPPEQPRLDRHGAFLLWPSIARSPRALRNG